MSLLAELRRRNVFKVALVYVVAAWLLLQLTAYVVEQLGLPGWTDRFVMLLLAIGYPLALYFAYIYEITPQGLRKTVDVDQTQSIVFKTGQKLNAALAVLIILGLISLALGRWLPEPPPPIDTSPEIVSSATLEGLPASIKSVTLDNGLQIIVWPDNDIPNVAMYYFVRAGGRNEYPGITGLSHFFEHLMFRAGASRLDPGEFDEVMEAAGGANNAYTSSDLTVYMNWFPASALETIFRIEADRLENLDIDAAVVDSERNVVAEARRVRVDNNNLMKLREQMLATAYIAHPYQFPVIGWPSDIEAWSLDDIETFFRTYYAPNNITMVIAGDVVAEDVFDLAEDYFDDLDDEDPPMEVRTVEPPQSGERRILVETDAQTPLLHIAFHAGSATDPGTLPMKLAMNILVGGDSSRLHRRLVEDEQIAVSVDGTVNDDNFDPGLVYFSLTLPPDGDPGLVEQRMLEELGRLATDGVSEAELDKARNIELVDFWRSLATIDGKAEALGLAEVFHGSYEALFDLPDTIEDISNDDIIEVAAAVFRRNNMTVGLLRAPQADAEEAGAE